MDARDSAESGLVDRLDEHVAALLPGGGGAPGMVTSEKEGLPPEPLPVHCTVHLGGFLSVEPILRSQALEMLDLLARDDLPPDSWSLALMRAEALLRDAYRAAMNAPHVRRVLTRAGNVFVGGQGEAGGATAHFLLSQRPIPSEGEGPAARDASSIADTVAAARLRIARGVEARSQAQEELRELLVAALLRSARRVYWLYMRQLWEAEGALEGILRADEGDEAMHRAV